MKIFEITSDDLAIAHMHDEYEFEDTTGLDYYEAMKQAENVVKSAGLNMLRDDEITLVAISSDVIVGVLYQSTNGNELRWSIAVDKNARNMGIAKKLYNEMYVPEECDTLIAELVPPYTLENMVTKLGYDLVRVERDFKIYKKQN